MNNFIEEEISNKSVEKVLLLAICGGFVGIHHYYLGNRNRGIFYSLTAGGMMILWISDIFKILGGRMYDGEGKRLLSKEQLRYFNSKNTIYKPNSNSSEKKSWDDITEG